jgi:hypothetical protein
MALNLMGDRCGPAVRHRMKRKLGRVTETIKHRRVDTKGEEKEIFLRGKWYVYLTG